MKARLTPNRAICAGDRGRFAPDWLSRDAIKARLSSWSTPFLTKFIPDASSGIWRQVATEVLEARLLPKKKKVHKQRNRAPKTSGHRVSQPVTTSLKAGTEAIPTAAI